MKKLIASLLLAYMVLAPALALAAEFRVSKGQAGTANLAENESAQNLYAAGNTVDVSGKVSGDLVAAGNTLNLQGDIESNLIGAGSTLNLSGKVGRNAKVAGSNINVTKNIGDDLMLAGATANISQNAKIGGDLYAAVGNLTLSGDVAGRVRVTGGDITVNGKIGGDLIVDGGKLTLGNNAVINGNVDLRAPQEATISTGAVVKGKVDYQKTEQKDYSMHPGKGALGFFGFIGFLMSLAVLFVLVYLLPRTSRDLVKSSLSKFWPNLGWGFLLFALMPTALIIITSTFIGLKIACILFMLYILALIIAFSYGALAIGSQILRWIEKKEYRVDWLTIIVGLIASAILAAIPVLGGLVVFAFALVILGQLVINTGVFIKSQHGK